MSAPWAVLLAAVVTVTGPALVALCAFLYRAARESGRADEYRVRSEATIAEKNLQLQQTREVCKEDVAAITAELAYTRQQLLQAQARNDQLERRS